MRWSVGIEAEGDRVLSREEVVELADAVAASSGIATGIGTNRYGAQLVVQAGSRDDAIGKATEQFTAAAARAGLPQAPIVRVEAISEDQDTAGESVAAVFAIAYRPDPETKPGRYAVIYVGHSDDLAAERFPFQHPRAHCWVRRAGSKWKVFICTYEVPGGGRPHREQIARELTAIYRPSCNTQQYDQAWKEHWIGEYTAPTTGPVARRGPGQSPSR